MDGLEELPKEVEKLSNNFKLLFTAEGQRLAGAYETKETDIFVVGAPKTGTTLLQHVRISY